MINLGTGFEIGSDDAIDSRIYLSKNQMKLINDNVMPSVYFAICSNDGKLYQYDKTRESNIETGKFIPFISEDGEINSQLTTWSSTVLNTKLMVIINDLNHEISTRTEENTTLRNNLEEETTNRTNCDNILRSDLTTEETTRISNINTLTSNLNAEISERINNISTLTTNLNTEISNRTSQSNTIISNLNEEIINRESGDNHLRNDLEEETTNRTNCDNALRSDLTTETNNRISCDNTLRSDLDNEIENRSSDISTLTNTLNNEIEKRTSDVSTLTENLTTETTNRTNCDNALRSDLTDEISTRTSNINTLTENLATETSNRTSCDNTLRSDLTTETTNRTNCDNALRSDLTTETNNRISCDNTLRSDITSINNVIPTQASSVNQLADKNFVNSSIQTATANYRGNWTNWASVPTDVSLYPEDYKGTKTPTVNDYLIVNSANDYTLQVLKGTWRFKYSGEWSINGKNGWYPEYQVNDEPFTSAQLASINSGATSEKISSYESHISNTSNPHNVTKSQVGLGNVVNVTTISDIIENSPNNITSGGVYEGLSTKVDKVSGKGLSTNDFDNDYKTKLTNIETNAQKNVQSDWNETCTLNDDFIKNKPTKLSDFTNDVVNNSTININKNGTLVDSFTTNQSSTKTINITVPTNNNELSNGCGYAKSSDLSTVATSGDYDDLSNVPTKLSDFTNDVVKNSTITIQKNGTNIDTFSLNQSTNKTINVTVPTNNNELSNGCGYAKSNDLSSVATSGNYNDLSNTPTNLSDFTNDVVNDSTITIQKNGINIDSFGTNQSSNKTINITVPTKTSDLTNDEGFAYDSDTANSTVYKSLLSECDENGNNITSTYSTKSELSTISSSVTSIENKIPSEASSSNQLADKSFVNSTLQTYTANFRGNWNSWLDVPTSSSNYPQDYSGSTIPTINDYLVIVDASDYNLQVLKGTWRFKYSGNWSTQGKNGWYPEYQVNDEPFTSAQLASINSGITSSLVNKLTNIETNAQKNVQSDWNETCTTSDSYIKNKPNLSTVATSGNYGDLSNTPTNLSDFTNDVVKNSTITIKKNNVTVDSFTLNQTSNTDINITVPTKVSDLSNDLNFTSCVGDVKTITLAGYTYQPTSSGNVDLGALTVETTNLSWHNTSNLPVTQNTVSEIISHGECNCSDRLELGTTENGVSSTIPINILDSILLKNDNNDKYISGGDGVSIGHITNSTLYL